ncbi:hypothetical protein DOTSEDRAFT_170246 [Dothistroma septosporum NZE10]|uniref:T6SS Phospholipase effector Tle1-like catalytic domain-containing protein n=1 Tax=Dothistroma septosporum (strain NZE10 / CBS 128990) TaxID=675120 RepID=N1PNU3_DOTSN|nr:hypothetical protein DOTSEDRAFT_170246 [Dothistroma septosporum NZE10]
MPKKLIVCCDGTWRNSDSGILKGTGLAWLWDGQEQVNTNVTRISRAIRSTDGRGRQQIVYYQAGVGSEGNLIERLVGGALGVGLAANIREAYSFLANNYVTGDEIFLIGFSRGAFTARSIGGLIGDLGLLTTDGMENLVDIFEDWEHAGNDGYKTLLAKDDTAFAVKASMADPKAYVMEYRNGLLQRGYTRDETIPIKAIGVWDTVGSLGIPVNPLLQRLGFPTVLREYRFYNTDLGNNVENAFQALALDEARAAYRPALWQKRPGSTSNLKQTWFPGVHTNIGGGYPDTGLSDITLAWMMSKLAPFIDFTPDYIKKQHQKHEQYLEKEHAPLTGLKWAASKLKNTSTGLRALLGIVWRQPGRYHVLNKKTLTVVHGKPLVNTNEHIHVAVRSRELTGGLDQKNKVVKYKPKALRNGEYELLDPNAKPGEASWRYVGKKKPFTGEVLPEDELGVFEKEIFTDYVTGST